MSQIDLANGGQFRQTVNSPDVAHFGFRPREYAGDTALGGTDLTETVGPGSSIPSTSGHSLEGTSQGTARKGSVSG